MDFTHIWDSMQGYVAVYGWNIIFAVVILVVGLLVSKMIRGTVRRIMSKRNLEPTLVAFVANISYAVMLIFVILASLSRLGVETTSFVAIVGAAGLAIGLALQGSLANFAAGFLLVMFKPLKVGEYVEAGGTAGTVEEVNIFTTVMNSPDNIEITVPNSQILSNTIMNYSRKETRRIDLVIGVGYNDDLKKVKQVLHDVIAKEPRVLADPEVTIAVSELADSSVNFVVRPWVKGPDYWAVRFDLIEAIKVRFDSEGISIPFPQRDLHMFQESTN